MIRIGDIVFNVEFTEYYHDFMLGKVVNIGVGWFNICGQKKRKEYYVVEWQRWKEDFLIHNPPNGKYFREEIKLFGGVSQ